MFPKVLQVVALIVVLAAWQGCATSADDGSGAGPITNTNSGADLAQSKLFVRDVEGAQKIYSERLTQDPSNANAAAGKAVTDLLLLPYSPSVTAVFIDALGATRPLNATRDVIYGDGGILYLLARGVPLTDGDSVQGVVSLLADDLPWTKQQMTSSTDFVEDLDASTNILWDRLEAVADDLSVVERNLKVALDGQEFKTYFLPGEVLHDQSLNLVMGKSELSAIRTIISTARAGIYFAAAYDFSWSLRDALGAQWDDVSTDDPNYTEAFEYRDYVMSFLVQRVFRSIIKPDRLRKAGASFADAAHGLAQTLRLGQSSPSNTVLDWDVADESLSEELASFADAVGDAVSGDTSLPYTVPPTSMSLSSFFTAPGRTLPSDLVWAEFVLTEDDFGTSYYWELPDATIQAVFIDGVMKPEFPASEAPEVEFSGDAVDLLEDVTSEFTGNIETTYLSAR